VNPCTHSFLATRKIFETWRIAKGWPRKKRNVTKIIGPPIGTDGTGRVACPRTRVESLSICPLRPSEGMPPVVHRVGSGLGRSGGVSATAVVILVSNIDEGSPHLKSLGFSIGLLADLFRNPHHIRDFLTSSSTAARVFYQGGPPPFTFIFKVVLT
jgi:hypothetical protein